jgi:hypothetical protein
MLREKVCPELRSYYEKIIIIAHVIWKPKKLPISPSPEIEQFKYNGRTPKTKPPQYERRFRLPLTLFD